MIYNIIVAKLKFVNSNTKPRSGGFSFLLIQNESRTIPPQSPTPKPTQPIAPAAILATAASILTPQTVSGATEGIHSQATAPKDDDLWGYRVEAEVITFKSEDVLQWFCESAAPLVGDDAVVDLKKVFELGRGSHTDSFLRNAIAFRKKYY